MEVGRATGEEGIAANRGAGGQPDSFYPVKVPWSHTGTGVGTSVARVAPQWAGSRGDDGTAVQRRVRIADVRPIGRRDRVVVAVRAIQNCERSSGLERGDTRDRPPAQGVPPQTRSRPRDRPQIYESEPLSAVIIAQAAIQLQPALRDRHRSQVRLVRLKVNGSNTVAGAVDVARPSIGRCQLEAAREAPIHAPLEGVISRIPLARVNETLPEIWMKTLSVQQARIAGGPRGQLVTLRADIRNIEEYLVRQLALEAERPALGVGTAKILIDRTALRIQ